MQIDWLKDLVTLVECGSFSKAAERRNTTQPAFSRRIQALEGWAGATLIDRRRIPVNVTPAGEILYGCARLVLSELEQSRNKLRKLSREPSHVLSVAATHSLSVSILPSLLGYARQSVGRLSFNLHTAPIRECMELFNSGGCNVIMYHHHPDSGVDFKQDNLFTVSIGTDKMIPVCSPANYPEPLFPVPGSPSCPTPLLAYTDQSAVGRAVNRMMSERINEAYVTIVAQSHLAAVLKRLAINREGVAWLLESDVVHEIAEGLLVKAGDESWDLQVDLRLTGRINDDNEVVQELWEFLLTKFGVHARL